MKFGVHLPHNGALASQASARDSLLRFATAADELDYDSCWASDHIAWPDPAGLTSRYPYSADGAFAASPDTPWIDALSALTFVAAVTERIRVDMNEISTDRFSALIEELWLDVEAVEQRGDVGKVSVFELLTAMSFVEFRSVNADVQVIEVGLGGRLAATNLVTPDVAVITTISHGECPVGLTVEPAVEGTMSRGPAR